MNKRLFSNMRMSFFAGLLASSVTIIQPVNAAVLTASGGATVTPTEYQVTIQKVEFLRADGTYFVFFEGSSAFDIAGVAAGASAGAFGSGASMEPGVSYTEMRMTISSRFGITAESADAQTLFPGSQRCFTGGAGGSAAVGTVNLTVAQSGAVGTATTQSVSIPTDVAPSTTVATAVAAAGLETPAGALRFSAPITLTVPDLDTTAPSGLSIDFDVTNTVEFIDTVPGGIPGTCFVMPLPPVVTVTTPDGTTTLDSGL